MANEVQIPIENSLYNQKMTGFYGEFGSKSGAQIHFLQSGLKPQELDKITLIGDIPGSESWSVRDLFQRDVDMHRVTSSILPYLKSQDIVKFFNPLTLTILPFDSKGNTLISITKIEPEEIEEGGRKYVSLEHVGYYRYRYLKDIPNYGILEWSDSKVRLVAIDGQHRLSALKRLYTDTDQPDESMRWTIPVVILGIRRTEKTPKSEKILDITRSIFIYINKTARPPNRCRQILLSDDSITSICAQELLEYAHENDVLETKKRDESRIPLMMFDWRGEEVGGRPQSSPTSLKKLEEIEDWLIFYLLGPDFQVEQKEALGLQPTDKLQQAFIRERLNTTLSKEVRGVFRERVLKGIAYFLENFLPYQAYISEIRELERKWGKESDIARHAFYEIRFGSNRAREDLQEKIKDLKLEIIGEIEYIKKMPTLIDDDIGMRGIMWAFSHLRSYYAKCHKKTPSDWLEYSKWFTKVLNNVYKDHWLDDSNIKKKELLKHLAYDHNDNRINYRLDQADRALGAFVGLLVAVYGTKKQNKRELDELRDDYIDTLTDTVLRGYKKEMKVKLRDDYPHDPVGLKEAVAKEAEKETKKHINKLKRYLDKITS